MIPRYDLNRIVTAAASLEERIACGVYDDAAPLDSARVQSRVEYWREKSAQGNPQKFDRRLFWSNLDSERACRILASDPRTLTSLPAWMPLLARILEYLEQPAAAPPLSLDPICLARTPFAQALAPLVGVGIQCLEEHVTSALLPPPVSACLRRNLLERLSEVCSLTLGEEFLRFRKAAGWAPGEGEGRHELYAAFVEGLSQGGLLDIFARYPVLGRLVSIATAHWVADMSGFLLRLDADRAGISARFFEGNPLRPIRNIHSSLSDLHRGGRTVKIVEFEDGRRLVYKPKSLACDEAWMHLVDWLRSHDAGLDLRAPLSWDRGEYGWVEFIHRTPCESLDAVRNFYRRAGALICLFYATLAGDFHQENLIAAGDQPVPIDLETLFVPRAKLLPGESERLAERFLSTVLQSLMLPAWHMSADQRTAYDISGLGSFWETQDGGTTLGWSHINTDAMQLTTSRVSVPPSRNLPSLPDHSIDPGDFVPELIDGFRHAYRCLMRLRDALLAPGGPIDAFRRCSTRLVMRASRTYAILLQRSLTPRLLQNGIDRSLEFEGLSRAMLAQSGDYDGASVFRAEVHALETLDIPYFDAPVTSSVVSGGNGDVRGILVEPSFDAAAARLRAFSEADLRYQAELIRDSFAMRDLKNRNGCPSRGPSAPASEVPAKDALIAEAEDIAARIASQAIWENDAAYWIGADYNTAIHRYSLKPVGPSLYSGRGGIAVFLAALESVCPKPGYRKLALGAARSIVNDWLGPRVDPETVAVQARGQGIGGAAGIPSAVYSLAATARLLRHPDLLDDALRISRWITTRDIQADQQYDVIGGAAGAILGLLPLWRETKDSTVAATVVQCAEHLVANQVKENGCAGGWKNSFGPRPLTGFSHGAAGISYALLQAHAVSDNPAFRTAARRALDYERSVFVPAENNWPDFREGCDFGRSWCHGSPGIGLARLASLSHDPAATCQRDLDSAIHWLKSAPPNPADHLCCGELGNLELFLEAGLRLNRPDLLLDARKRGLSVLARAGSIENGRRSGFHSNFGPCESIFMPGLFNGLAGIGYQLLRLAAPERVPSVLLWN